MESRFHISRAELKRNTRKNEHESGKKLTLRVCMRVRVWGCVSLCVYAIVSQFIDTEF